MFIPPREYFRFHGTAPRKRFGQHFLTQAGTAERIVESANLEVDETVIEVGPGLGALTQFILPRVSRLHLIELDRDLADHLEKSLEALGFPAFAEETTKGVDDIRFARQDSPERRHVFIHKQDVLTFDFLALSRAAEQQLVILGNLPYNISSPLVFHLLESRSAINRAVFMLQREVGERLAASPGTKDYGVLSVLLGIYARVSPLFSVGPQQFYPPPKVESLVISIDFSSADPKGAPSFQFLRGMINSAFQQRRKKLHNSLRSFARGNTAALDNAFARTGIDSKRRPETLTPVEFVQLGRAFEEELNAHISMDSRG